VDRLLLYYNVAFLNLGLKRGGWLVLQVSSEDPEPGVGLFKHNSPIDRYVQVCLLLVKYFLLIKSSFVRPAAKFSGINNIHFNGYENYLLLPMIP
jgi:hypothetical protein